MVLQSNQEKRTPQDCINELIIGKLNPLIVPRTRQMGFNVQKNQLNIDFGNNYRVQYSTEFNIQIFIAFLKRLVGSRFK